jgi:hypothetical protein
LHALADLALRHAPAGAPPIAAPQSICPHSPAFFTSVHVVTPIDHCLSRMREQLFLHPQTVPYQAHEPPAPAQCPATIGPETQSNTLKKQPD